MVKVGYQWIFKGVDLKTGFQDMKIKQMEISAGETI